MSEVVPGDGLADGVFVDTSIQIARFIHAPEMKQRIEERLSGYSVVYTGRIVRQEFRRRFLGEAAYLEKLVREKKSYGKVRRHLEDVLGGNPFQKRRQRICIQTLSTVFESAEDEDLTYRLTLYLRRLKRSGMTLFDHSVDVVMPTACALSAGGDAASAKCSMTSGCEIGGFLAAHERERDAILECLSREDPESLTDELRAGRQFLLDIKADNGAGASRLDPCLRVGDVMIALESSGINHFYTINRKESRHLCSALRQTLVHQPSNYNLEGVVLVAPTSAL